MYKCDRRNLESKRTHDWHAYPYRMLRRKVSGFWMGIPLLLAGSFVLLSAPSPTSTCTSKTPGSNWRWNVAWWCTVWASNSSSKCHLIWIYVSLVPKPWTLSYTYTLLIGQKIYNNWGLVLGGVVFQWCGWHWIAGHREARCGWWRWHDSVCGGVKESSWNQYSATWCAGGSSPKAHSTAESWLCNSWFLKN